MGPSMNRKKGQTFWNRAEERAREAALTPALVSTRVCALSSSPLLSACSRRERETERREREREKFIDNQ
jgi:hypothetical protein